MKHQEVGVDYWAMGKAMLMYAFLTAMGWVMLRLFNTVFMLPRRLRSQQQNIQDTLKELQKRFPDLNVTEQDLKDAEKELEEYMKEQDEKKTIAENEDQKEISEKPEDKPSESSHTVIEDKKTI